jgi:membrane-associated protein
MDIISLFQLFLHIDDYLLSVTETYGLLTYLILFAVIFLETGLVVTPFLPGDSLLFVAGAIASLGSLNVWLLVLLLFFAAVLGDTANYFIGSTWGRRIAEYAQRKNFIINYNHIKKTEEFYEKYGGSAIILARFVPIIRTFAPFVAGLGKMDYKRFIIYNLSGGLLWVLLFVLGGFFFGNIPIVKENFSIVIIVIIIISIIPIIIELIKLRK